MAIARAKMVAILNTVIGLEAKSKRENQGSQIECRLSTVVTSRIAKIVFCYRAHLLGQQLGRGQFRYKRS